MHQIIDWVIVGLAYFGYSIFCPDGWYDQSVLVVDSARHLAGNVNKSIAISNPNIAPKDYYFNHPPPPPWAVSYTYRPMIPAFIFSLLAFQTYWSLEDGAFVTRLTQMIFTGKI